MADYVKRNWNDGEIITANALNRMEAGIAQGVRGNYGDLSIGFKDFSSGSDMLGSVYLAEFDEHDGVWVASSPVFTSLGFSRDKTNLYGMFPIEFRPYRDDVERSDVKLTAVLLFGTSFNDDYIGNSDVKVEVNGVTDFDLVDIVVNGGRYDDSAIVLNGPTYIECTSLD